MKNRSQLIVETLDAIHDSIEIELIRFNIECHSTSEEWYYSFFEYEDSDTSSLIQLNYKAPLGNIIIHLDNQIDSANY